MKAISPVGLCVQTIEEVDRTWALTPEVDRGKAAIRARLDLNCEIEWLRRVNLHFPLCVCLEAKVHSPVEYRKANAESLANKLILKENHFINVAIFSIQPQLVFRSYLRSQIRPVLSTRTDGLEVSESRCAC